MILQVNSLGGVVSKTRMEALFNKIIDSKIPIAVWVGPTTARAYGSAAQLLAVADVSAMADGTRIGKTGRLLTTNAGEVSFGDASATLRTTTVNSKEAKRLGALKLTTDDEGVPVLRNMLLAMNGLSIKGQVLQTVVEVKSDSGDELIREAATTRFFKLGLLERLLHTAASPPVTFLLVIIGLALLIFEFFTAGIGIAGVVGAVCVVLGSHGLATLPLRGSSLAVIILAMNRVLTRWGERLEHEVVSEAGDFLFVPPGVPHEAINLSASAPARAVVARNDPDEQDKVEPVRIAPG